MTQKPNPLEGELEDIDIELIDPPKHDARAWIKEEHLEQLAESLDTIGLIHEPVVAKIEDRYEIVSGHCRLLAARRLDWETLRCKVVDKARLDQDFIKLHENLYRQDLSVVEKATFLASTKERYSLTDQDLGDKFGMSRTWVTRTLGSLKWPEDLQQANEDGVLSFEVCDALRKVKDPDYRASLIRYAIQDGCTKKLANQWYNEWLRNERIKENIKARDENPDHSGVVQSDDELLEDAREQQQANLQHRLGALKKSCSLCGHHHDQQELINWDLCPECVQYVYNIAQQQLKETQRVPEG